MNTAWWIGMGASMLVGATTFVLGWWLGRRRPSVQVRALRRELWTANALARHEREALGLQYNAMLRNAVQAAMEVVRAQRRQS